MFVDECRGAEPGGGGGDSGSETEIEEEVDGGGGGAGAGGGGGGEEGGCDFENTVAYQVTDPLTSGDEDETEGAGPFESYSNKPTLAYNLHEEDEKDNDTQQESKQQQTSKQTRSVKYDQTVPYSLTEEQSDGHSGDRTAPNERSNAATPAISGDQTTDYTVDTDTEGEEVGSEVRSKNQNRTGKLFKSVHTGLNFYCNPFISYQINQLDLRVIRLLSIPPRVRLIWRDRLPIATVVT